MGIRKIKMRLRSIFLLFYPISISFATRRKNPIKHSELLQDIISNYVASNMNDTSESAQILNDIAASRVSAGPDRALDPLTLKTIVGDLKKDVILRTRKYQYMSLTYEEEKSVFQRNDKLVNKTLELMRQSIYGARRKLHQIHPFRRDSYSFKIGLHYGRMQQLLKKMDSHMMTMNTLLKSTHFIWFLILYEKILAISIDMEDSVGAVFTMLKDAEKEELQQKMNELAANAKAETESTFPGMQAS